MDYRSELDVLRVIAVSLVILFRSSNELFSGGYIGDDVFFVIRG
jgi:peptidoglycan/LPS O-acetylase OafA/YrhL